MSENGIVTLVVLMCVVTFFMVIAGTYTERTFNSSICKHLYSKVTDYDACMDKDIRVNIKLIKELK